MSGPGTLESYVQNSVDVPGSIALLARRATSVAANSFGVVLVFASRTRSVRG